MKKLIIAYILITVTLCLASCGIVIINVGDKTAETSATPAPITETTGKAANTQTAETSTSPVSHTEEDDFAAARENLLKLLDKDFGGVGITVATSSPEALIPSAGDDAQSRLLLTRNSMVNKKYNTITMVKGESVQDILNNSYTAHLAGLYYADLLAVPLGSIAEFYSRDYLLNLNSLPFCDFTKDYFNENAVSQLSAGDMTYGVMGEAYMNMDSCCVVFFNRDMAEKLGLDIPYELVRDGKWTWEVYYTMAAAATAGGQLGHASSLGADSLTDSIVTASGVLYTYTDAGGLPKLSEFTEREAGIIAVIKKLLFGEKNTFYTKDDALNRFYDGKLLFYVGKLSTYSWLTDMKDNWGILPMPKYDEAQEGYFSPLDPGALVFTTVRSNANAENTGLYLQAVNAASEGYLTDAYIENLINNVIRDNGTLNMLGYIRDTQTVDFASVFGKAFPKIAETSYKPVRDAVRRGKSIEYSANAVKFNKAVADAFGKR